VRLLVLHNFYSFTTGEDLIVKWVTTSLKKSDSFEVETYYHSSKEFHSLPVFKKFLIIFRANVPFGLSKDLRKKINLFKPEIVLIHNLIPLINPWVLPLLIKLRIPVIASIYNYRYFCPAGTCTRDRNFCCDCFPGLPFAAIWHNCLDNIFYSLLYTWRYLIQRSFIKYINVFVTSTFYRKGFYERLLPAKDIKFLAPFLDIPTDLINNPSAKSNYVVFAGRLVKEKGIDHFLTCAQKLPHIEFKICGDGPLRTYCTDFICSHNLKNITFEGWVERQELLPIIQQARLLIFPSFCYEFGLVKCEAMLLKTPILTIDDEANRMLITDHNNGFLYDPMDVKSLPKIVDNLYNNEALLERVAQRAFERVQDYNDEQRFTKGFYDICYSLMDKQP